jgi:hypothetical protein
MSVLTGQAFLDNLNKFLSRAEMPNSAAAWYSFWPKTNQSSFEFVFNDLYSYNEHFLGLVSSTIITDYGLYDLFEPDPTVTFTANGDAGYGASGITVKTANVISSITLTSSGQNYVNPPIISISAPSGGLGTTALADAVLSPDTGRVYANLYPGFSVGNNNNIISTLSNGTGLFVSGKNDFLRVGNHLSFNDWTVFLNFSHSGYASGMSKVLLSTMESGNQSSGFLLGINDANRLFFEYIDNTTYSYPTREVQVHDKELNTYNLISVSHNNSNKKLSICNHNIAKQGTFGLTYNLDGYNTTNVLYIGGFNNSGNSPLYTGFYGIMNDFLLLNRVATPQQCDLISNAFFSTGYSLPMQIPVQESYIPITGVSYTSTIIGTGVTGYYVNTLSISDKDGTPITAYELAEWIGSVTGNNIVYLTGAAALRTGYAWQAEQVLYDNNYIKKYTDNNLIFLSHSGSLYDLVELYNYSTKDIGQISIKPQYFNLYDYYLSNTFNSDSITYNNGLLQLRGITYPTKYAKTIRSGEYYSNWAYILSDNITGAVYTQAWTGGAGVISSNPTRSETYDIYLNGQKLINDYDYSVGGGGDVTLPALSTGTWSSGTLAFVPMRMGGSYYVQSGIGYKSGLSTIMDEMVWVNGQRFTPDEDYKVVPNLSLINSSSRAAEVGFTIYEGDLYFPLSILMQKPNI